MGKKHLQEEPLQDTFDLGIEVPEDPSVEAGKVANAIFRPWYMEYYQGRYGQPIGSITAALKRFVLRTVIQGEHEVDDIKEAMKHLGIGQKVVTEMSLQYALDIVMKRRKAKANSGAFNEMADQEEFTNILHHTYEVSEEDYGTSGSEF